jgi:hypothetical protein
LGSFDFQVDAGRFASADGRQIFPTNYSPRFKAMIDDPPKYLVNQGDYK